MSLATRIFAFTKQDLHKTSDMQSTKADTDSKRARRGRLHSVGLLIQAFGCRVPRTLRLPEISADPSATGR